MWGEWGIKFRGGEIQAGLKAGATLLFLFLYMENNYTNTYDPVSGYLLTTQPEYLGEQYPAYSFRYVKSK
jgi:hypothetical protein